MLVLTPQVALGKHGRGALQDSSQDGYDMVRVLEQGTRYSSQVSHPDQLPHKLLQALSLARSEPCGPVHLSIPSDLLAGARPERSLRVSPAQWPPPRRWTLPVDELERMWGALTRARRPAFYAGDDAGPGAQRLFDIAAEFGGTVITSPAGKRWVSHRSPRYAGVLGFSGHAAALQALRDADLVIALGVTFDELSTNAWTALPTAPTFVVDAHGSFASRVPHARPILVEPRAALDWLAARLPARTAPASCYAPAPLSTQALAGSAHGPVHPTDLMQWLSAALPDSVVVHVDTGNAFSWSTRDMARGRADTYRIAMGLSTMGWAIGAALGAAVASGERTLCIVGDGAFLMSSLELCVAVQEQLPITFVVLNDGGFGMVKHGQRLAGAPSIAHATGEVRFDVVAQGLGAGALRVESYAELERIPRRYLESADEGPCLIDIVIDGEAIPPMMDRVIGLASGIPK
jgi:acetolactate synthase-1/2/3 large subunit